MAEFKTEEIDKEHHRLSKELANKYNYGFVIIVYLTLKEENLHIPGLQKRIVLTKRVSFNYTGTSNSVSTYKSSRIYEFLNYLKKHNLYKLYSVEKTECY